VPFACVNQQPALSRHATSNYTLLENSCCELPIFDGPITIDRLPNFLGSNSTACTTQAVWWALSIVRICFQRDFIFIFVAVALALIRPAIHVSWLLGSFLKFLYALVIFALIVSWHKNTLVRLWHNPPFFAHTDSMEVPMWQPWAHCKITFQYKILFIYQETNGHHGIVPAFLLQQCCSAKSFASTLNLSIVSYLDCCALVRC